MSTTSDLNLVFCFENLYGCRIRMPVVKDPFSEPVVRLIVYPNPELMKYVLCFRVCK